MMETSPLVLLYVVCIILVVVVRRFVLRLPELLWTGVVLALLGLGLLYAHVAIRIRRTFPEPA